MLTPLHIIFLFFAFTAVLSAVGVITARNPVQSVLSLVVTFFAMSGVWMILHAEFLSLILLLVYVGAVMTLFLFVVMMLNIDKESIKWGFVRYLPFGIVIILLLTGFIIVAEGPQYFGVAERPIPAPEPAHYSNISQLGRILYTDFAYPFEIAGVILLAAIVAAITLTFRGPRRRKVQSTRAQLAKTPENSVRLINIPSATKAPPLKKEET